MNDPKVYPTMRSFYASIEILIVCQKGFMVCVQIAFSATLLAARRPVRGSMMPRIIRLIRWCLVWHIFPMMLAPPLKMGGFWWEDCNCIHGSFFTHAVFSGGSISSWLATTSTRGVVTLFLAWKKVTETKKSLFFIGKQRQEMILKVLSSFFFSCCPKYLMLSQENDSFLA